MTHHYYQSQLPCPIHVLHNGDHWHIWWNLLRKDYKKYGIDIHKLHLDDGYTFVIYFGKGEFVIDWYPGGRR